MSRDFAKIVRASCGAQVLFFVEPDGDAYKFLVQLVKEKKLNEKVIDKSVARVLHEKFMLGLFENPYAKEDGVDAFVGNAKHVAFAQTVAEKSIVLLKNDKNVLPLPTQFLSHSKV